MDVTQILKKSGLSEEAILEFSNRLQPEIIKEREYFVRYGARMNRIGILYEGTMVSRFSDIEGKEIASKFYFPQGDNLVVDYYSFKNQMKSEEEIQAIEKSKLLILKYEDYKFLVHKYPSLQNLVIKFAEDSYLKALNRIRDFQLLSAKERIKNFLESHQLIVNKIMVKDKASYLGITRNIFTENMKKI